MAALALEPTLLLHLAGEHPYPDPDDGLCIWHHVDDEQQQDE